MIGGTVLWADNANGLAVRRMATRAARPGGHLRAEQGSAGFMISTQTERLESTDDIWVIADLDVTNLDELQQSEGAGPDPEGLLAALYRRHGPRFLERLHGAFALGLWDGRTRTLLLAVDRFGIKRLHYTSNGQGLAFASRPSALLAVPGVEGGVDPTAVYNYLNFAYVPAPGSIFRGIARLEPGQFLLHRDGQTTLGRYWDLRFSEENLSEAAAADRVFAATEQAVRTALAQCTPKETGAFLSGGTDSSTIVGLMTRITGEAVNAFSIGFEEDRYDELAYADLAARHFGAKHYKHIVTADEAFDLLPRIVESYDEPFGNNSALGTFRCAELARQSGVTRLLAGDGGDEIFGGNERYRTDRIFARYHRIPAMLRRRVLEPIVNGAVARGMNGVIGRAHRYIRRANVPNPRRFYSYEFFFARDGHDLLSPEFCAQVHDDAPNQVLEAHYANTGTVAELNRLLYLDLKLTIGDNDLLKVTRTADLAGVAVRFPLLGPSLVDLMATLPARFKVRGLEKRYLFKRAFRELLPRETLAKRKHGFGVPTSVWLREHRAFRDLARDILLSSQTQQRGYFRPGALARLFALHAADPTPYYGDLLWTVLMLELWHRCHLGMKDAG